MILAAGPWYTSGTFWSVAVSAVAVIVAAVLGAWLTQRKPRRLLVYTAKARQLLAEQSASLLNSDLQVVYHGSPLVTPYLVSLSVLSKSRTDIRRDDFDGGKPLIFNMGTPIVGVLASAVPGIKNRSSDWFRVDGSNILVGPALIHKGQSIILDVLTDAPPRVTYQSDLAGVTVAEEKAGEALIRRWRAVAAIAIVIVVSNIVTGLLSHSPTSPGNGTAGRFEQNAGFGPSIALVSPQPGKPPQVQSTSVVLTDPATGGVRSVAYSPDHKYLAAGDANGHFFIWSATGKLSRNIGDPSSLGIYAVTFSRNDAYFATGDGNGNIYLWSHTFTLLATLPDPQSGGVRSIAFSPDNNYLAAGDLNGNIFVWSTATHKLVSTLPDPDSFGVYAVAFSQDNSYLAAGDGNGHVYLWTHKLAGSLTISQSGGIRAVAFSFDNNYLAASDVNGYTYIWSTATHEVISKPALPAATYGVNALAFSPDGRYLAVGDGNGHLYLWSHMLTRSPSLILQTRSSEFLATGALMAVAFSANSGLLAAGASNGHLYQWSGPF